MAGSGGRVRESLPGTGRWKKKSEEEKKSEEKEEERKRKKKKRCALTAAALLTLQLLLRLEGLAQALQVEHPRALTLTRHQLLTSLLTHLQTDQTW